MERTKMKGKKPIIKITITTILFLFIVINIIFPKNISSGENISVMFSTGNQYPPDKPTLVEPFPNGTTISSEHSATLIVYISDPDGNKMNVSFYKANGELIDTKTFQTNDTTTQTTWTGLSAGTTYRWYVKVNDTKYENISDTWVFKTDEESSPPNPPNPPPPPPPEEIPPEAIIIAPDKANISEKVFFIGNESEDEDGEIVEYKWDINGDNQTDFTTENLNYTFNTTGYHNITLTVEDDQGLLDSFTHTIKITQHPFAKINTTWGNIGYIDKEKTQNLRFSANESYDLDGKITGYRWDFNTHDNISWDTEWLNSTVDHYLWNYSKTGNYTIKLQVKDNDNLTDIDLYNITIKNTSKELPIAKINATTQVYLGKKIIFNASESYDPDGEIISYTWYFGDGNISYKQNATHIYNKTGIYLVVLEVKDDDNLTNTEKTWVNIIKKTEPEENKTIKPSEDDKKDYTAPFEIILAILAVIVSTIIILIIFLNKKKKTENQEEKKDEKPKKLVEKPKEDHKEKTKKTDKQKIKRKKLTQHNIKDITKISGIGPSVVITLEKEGIDTLEQIDELTEEELLEIDGIGKKTCKTIKKNLPDLIDD